MALLALSTGCSGCSGGESFSCVGPYLDDQGPAGTYGAPPARVARGDAFIVYAHAYAATCHDTNHDGTASEPLPPVRLTLHLPGGAAEDLGSFTPSGADLGFRLTVRIPTDAVLGSASISDDRTPPAVYGFTVVSS